MDLDVIGKAVFRTVDEETGEVAEVELSADDVEIETDTHDPDREMGAEYVHAVRAHVGEVEVIWLVYEYPEGEINLVTSPSQPEMIQDFKFSLI